MPGLFGSITLDGRPLDARPAAALLDEMERRLGHLGELGFGADETVDRWQDLEHGVAVRRIRSRRHPAPPWPVQEERGGPAGGTLFVDGVLHADVPGPAEAAATAPGVEAFAQLEGFFHGLRIRPGVSQGPRAVLAVDRRASRPLVWTVIDRTLHFAPEVKALLAIAGLRRELDPAALGIFFASGFVLAHQTLFATVRRLAGGTAVVVDGGEAKIERYWRYRMTVDGDGTPTADLEDELATRLQRAVARNYDDPEHDVVLLSGGRDSRILLGGALASAGEGGRVRAASWAADALPPGSDADVATRLASELGFEHRLLRRSLDDWPRRSLRLAYLLDGLTDISAFHAYELEILRRLAADGVTRVLRGDQCVTRGTATRDRPHSFVRMSVRSLSDPARVRAAFLPAAYDRWREASDAAVVAVAEDYDGVHPENVRDEVYFAHRLQGYLNPAAYFKQLLVDHRNPLLDEGLLDLHQRLPVDQRRDQRIFRRAAARAFPRVWNHPFSTSDNLENFAWHLGRPSPVRRGVESALADTDCGLWEYLDREALQSRLAALGSARWLFKRSPTKPSKTAARRFLRGAVGLLPALDVRLRSVYLRRVTREDEVFFRVLVLKQFFDLFVAGDGGRQAFAAALARVPADREAHEEAAS